MSHFYSHFWIKQVLMGSESTDSQFFQFRYDFRNFFENLLTPGKIEDVALSKGFLKGLILAQKKTQFTVTSPGL